MSQTTDTNTLIESIHAFAQAAGDTDRILAASIKQTNQLAVAAGTAAQTAHELAQQAKEAVDGMAVSVSKEGAVVTITATDNNGTTTATVRDGQDGASGEKGEPGDTGPAPAHQWDGTSLQFQNPDGTWGNAVDLRGQQGPAPADASTSSKGVVQLSNAIDSSSEAMAATPKAVKAAIAKAEGSASDALAGKADTDLGNVTAAGKAAMAHAAMPSDKHIEYTWPSQSNVYVYPAPADGYWMAGAETTASSAGGFVLSSEKGGFHNQAYNNLGNGIYAAIPVRKGDKIKIVYSNINLSSAYLAFVYANGSAPEA